MDKTNVLDEVPASNSFATITDLIPVMPIDYNGEKWLKISVPNDWEDVKKICKKVLLYKGETYVFRGWNSDTHYCNFIRCNEVAKIVRKRN